mmetsp:Transcript_68770/g.174747  ORF Transcript_68770/g.174747 Transcript_68770/m.174747 type:complete len:209 (+) Transcript_68770:81-707(+)
MTRRGQSRFRRWAGARVLSLILVACPPLAQPLLELARSGTPGQQAPAEVAAGRAWSLLRTGVAAEFRDTLDLMAVERVSIRWREESFVDEGEEVVEQRRQERFKYSKLPEFRRLFEVNDRLLEQSKQEPSDRAKWAMCESSLLSCMQSGSIWLKAYRPAVDREIRKPPPTPEELALQQATLERQEVRKRRHSGTKAGFKGAKSGTKRR